MLRRAKAFLPARSDYRPVVDLFDTATPVWEPAYAASADVYACISDKLEARVEEGIRVRSTW